MTLAPIGLRVLKNERFNCGVRGVTAVTVRFQARMVWDDGETDLLLVDIVSSTDRSVVTGNDFAEKDGYITNASTQIVDGTPPAQFQEVVVEAGIRTSSGRSSFLLAGSILNGRAPSFPGPFTHPLEEPPRIVYVSSVQPGAGANPAAQAIPANAIWKPKTVFANLVTAAAAANRRAAVNVNSSGLSFPNYAGGAQPASVNISYTWEAGGAFSDTNDFALVTTPDWSVAALADRRLMFGDTIQVVALNIQGADQWTGTTNFAIEEWMAP